MDRPEWGGVNPVNGEVYMTLTNNSQRGSSTGQPLDPANPRFYTDSGGAGNVNGHIIRWRETDGEAAATTFTWDIYLFGAQANVDAGGDIAHYQANVNLSGLTDDNDFSSPDGLWFSKRSPGLLWIETDDGAYTDTTNCMLLAALPGELGDGGVKEVKNLAVPQNGNSDQMVTTRVGALPAENLKRFLVGPKGSEITGIVESPDGRAIFLNIQHPGEDTSAGAIANPAGYQSHWPANDGNARPRSATIVITRNDGGLIAV
jgi:secreted PhoX family phosphatase